MRPHSTPTLLAAPCLGSRTLDEDAITSNARNTALLRSIASRRGSLSFLVGITNGVGWACLARSFGFLCDGRRVLLASLLLADTIGFTAVTGFFLRSSRSDCSCWLTTGALILIRNQHRFPYHFISSKCCHLNFAATADEGAHTLRLALSADCWHSGSCADRVPAQQLQARDVWRLCQFGCSCLSCRSHGC